MDDSQEEFVERFRNLIMSAAPALNLSRKHPISSELLFSCVLVNETF